MVVIFFSLLLGPFLLVNVLSLADPFIFFPHLFQKLERKKKQVNIFFED